MNRSEVRYDVPLKVMAKYKAKHLTKDKYYKCIGEFVLCNGDKLLVVIDDSKFDNLHYDYKFTIIGDYEERKNEDGED